MYQIVPYSWLVEMKMIMETQLLVMSLLSCLLSFWDVSAVEMMLRRPQFRRHHRQGLSYLIASSGCAGSAPRKNSLTAAAVHAACTGPSSTELRSKYQALCTLYRWL